MKFHPIPLTSYETTRSMFIIQILHHCSMSWKITHLYFFLAQTFQKPVKVKFSDLRVVR